MARLNQKNLLWAGLGAAGGLAAGIIGLVVSRRYRRDDFIPAPALKGDGVPGAVGASGNVRSAGREEMRDPPRKWDRVDETSDESFPASDPAYAPHID